MHTAMLPMPLPPNFVNLVTLGLPVYDSRETVNQQRVHLGGLAYAESRSIEIPFYPSVSFRIQSSTFRILFDFTVS